MTTLKINGIEYKIKYGYEATARCGVIDSVTELEKLMEKGENMENSDLNAVLVALPKILLAGLQKYHKDEFGYDYDTGEGKQEALNKAFGLVDDYFDDNEEADIVDLFNLLSDEMVKNGFLARMLQSGADVQEGQNQKDVKKTRQTTTKKATA